MTSTLADFPYVVCSPAELGAEERRYCVRVPLGRLRATALRLCAEEYDDGIDRSELLHRVRRRLRRRMGDEGYGSIIIGIILLTVFEATIAWAVERFWNWITNKDDAAEVIAELQAEKQAE